MTRLRQISPAILFMLIQFFGSPLSADSQTILPPLQPQTAAVHGALYPHKQIRISIALQSPKVYVYEPAYPAPAAAPVLAYLHGKCGGDPALYQSFIEHTVRKGYSVIFPVYNPGCDAADGFDFAAAAGIQAGLAFLYRAGHVRPLGSGIALGGHSAGAWIAAFLAYQMQAYGLPPAAALVLHEPSSFYAEKYFGDDAQYPGFLFDNYYPVIDHLAKLPATTSLLSIFADQSVRDVYIPRFGFNSYVWDWALFDHIPCGRKNLIEVRSDDHGTPTNLLSDHYTVLGNRLFVDVLDWRGYWGPTVALLNLTFYGTNAEDVIGSSTRVRDMGRWSDGAPVIPKSTQADFGFCR